MISCLIADDQAMVREGFGALLAAQPGIAVSGLAAFLHLRARTARSRAVYGALTAVSVSPVFSITMAFASSFDGSSTKSAFMFLASRRR